METKITKTWKWLLKNTFVVFVSLALTVAVFLLLPVMQTIASGIRPDLEWRAVDSGWEPPPPPPPPPEEEMEEEEEPPEPPKLSDEAPPLDLSQLELALNPGFGEGMFGDFSVGAVNQIASGDSEEVDKIFSLDELDQRPRVVFQRMPTYPRELAKAKRKGTVYVVFIVDTDGRVLNPKVQKSTDPAFERPALEAVRQWKFEPGTRGGKKVQFKLRIPITFNAG